MGIVPSFNINELILFWRADNHEPDDVYILFRLVPMINAVLAYGATRLGWLSRVVSLTRGRPRPLSVHPGCKLDAKPGGDVLNLHGDVSGNLSAIPPRL